MRRLALWGILSLGLSQGYEKDVQRAFSLARQTRKPVWLLFTATWCPYCQAVEREVLPDSAFGAALRSRFIPLKVYVASDSANTPGGDSLARRYGVRAYPTFVCTEPDGLPFYRQEGLPVALQGTSQEELIRAFLQEISRAEEARKKFARLRLRFQQKDRSLPFLREYVRSVVEVRSLAEVEKVWAVYLQTAGSVRLAWLGEPGYFELLAQAAEMHPRYAAYAIEISDTLRADLDSLAFRQLYSAILLADFGNFLRGVTTYAEQVDGMEAYIRRHKKRFPFVERVVLPQVWRKGIGSSDSVVQAKAVELALRSVALGWPEEIPEASERPALAQNLGRVAWTFYRRVQAPDKLWMAVGWVKYALSLTPEDWSLWETLGALYFKLGRKAEAQAALEKALLIAQQEGVEHEAYADTEALLEQVKAMPD